MSSTRSVTLVTVTFFVFLSFLASLDVKAAGWFDQHHPPKPVLETVELEGRVKALEQEIEEMNSHVSRILKILGQNVQILEKMTERIEALEANKPRIRLM